MSITKYQVFLKTVECGSFSKAAQQLNYTQPGVSHAVQALEEELGVTLLCRNRGGVSLTADGRALLGQIRRLCAEYHKLEQAAADLRGLDAGLVKVATFSSVSAQWLPSILKGFGEKYPHIEFEVVTGDFYEQIEEWIATGEVDCGFMRLPSVRNLQVYPLHRDLLQVILPCNHPAAQKERVSVELLREEPFIHLEEGDDYEIMAAFDAMGIRPKVRHIARDDRTILAMVSKGLGISLLPELMVRHSPYPLAVCHPPETFHRSIAMAVKDKEALSQSTVRFVEYVQEWVRDNGDK